jgi:hypothetical protein
MIQDNSTAVSEAGPTSRSALEPRSPLYNVYSEFLPLWYRDPEDEASRSPSHARRSKIHGSLPPQSHAPSWFDN